MSVRDLCIQGQRSRCVAILSLLVACCSGTAQDAGAKGPAGIPVPPRPSPVVRSLGVLRYKDVEAARTAWLSARPGATVEPLTVDGRPVLKMTCDFEGPEGMRMAWHRAMERDLTDATALVFDVYAENGRAVKYCRIDLKSSEGWYVSPRWSPKSEKGWCRVRIRKSEFRPYKSPAGWSKVSAIRILPHARERRSASLYLANFGVEEHRSPVVLLRQEHGLDPDRQKQAERYTAAMDALLEEAGVVAPMVGPEDLTPAVLKGRIVVLMPYAVGLSSDATDALIGFLRSGGKVIACHSIPPTLAEVLGVVSKGFHRESFEGEFSSMRFVEQPPAGVPRQINQVSRALILVEPVPGRGRVAAWWHSADGKRTAAPAIVLSKHGAYISYVIHEDDRENKRALLKGLVSLFCPQIRSAYKYSCERRMAELGMVLGEFTWRGALARVRALPDFNEKAASALAKAEKQCIDAEAKQAAGRFEAAFGTAAIAEEWLIEAFCLAQRAQTPEFRGTWCPGTERVAGKWSWDEAAAVLADAGIDNLFLKSLCGACASYPLSVYRDLGAQEGEVTDILAKAIEACGKVGIKVHVHTTSFHVRLETATVAEGFVDKLKGEGRLQVKVDGTVIDSLCPSSEQNRKLLIAAIAETALKPGLAGIHLDYIRYPGKETCYCPGCRARFEQGIGRKVDRWPQDVLDDAQLEKQWQQFRCDNITRFVREVRGELRRAAPKCIVSAAVFKDYPQCTETVAQDWKLWVDKGYLDFVCPMDYTASHAEFDDQVRNQLDIIGDRIPCYPGIGLLTGLGPVGAIRQIQITRAHKTGGFCLWSVRPEYVSVYPYLGKGITASR